ncbi:MAG: hypothetical protein ACRDS9_01915 [Pseudonocardiaceae bacterium]
MLYALPPADLVDGVTRMVAALRPGGSAPSRRPVPQATISPATTLTGPPTPPGVTPYTDAEALAAALAEAGADVAVQRLHYRTGSSDRAVIEGFLQRCAFDDTVSLAQMEAEGPLAEYLADCRAPEGSYLFEHEAHLMVWEN